MIIINFIDLSKFVVDDMAISFDRHKILHNIYTYITQYKTTIGNTHVHISKVTHPSNLLGDHWIFQEAVQPPNYIVL